jgi:hypothetical protein
MLRTTGPLQSDPDTVNPEAIKNGQTRSIGLKHAFTRTLTGYLDDGPMPEPTLQEQSS